MRYSHIDLLRGGAIISVVLYHLTFFYAAGKFLRVPLEPFFIQLFIFISGIFFKSDDNFIRFINKKIKTLIVPLLFFYFLNYFAGFLASQLAILSGSQIVDQFSFDVLFDLFNGKEFFTYSGAVWFLVCLFNINIIYYYINKITNRWYVIFVALFISVVGYSLSVYSIDLPYFFDSSLSLLVFFALGHYFKMIDGFLLPSKFDFTLFLIFIVLYVLSFSFFDLSSTLMYNKFSSNFLISYCAALFGCLSCYYICKILKKNRLINYFGVNSIIILGTHQVLIVFFALVLNKVFANGLISMMINFVFIMSLELLIIFFLLKWTPQLVGRLGERNVRRN